MRNILLYSQITNPILPDDVIEFKWFKNVGESELSNYNFSIKYRPREASVNCDCLSRTPVKSFESHSEETDFLSVSTIISDLSTSSGNWITVSRSTPNILGNFNFKNVNTPDTINLEELKNKQKTIA